MDTPLCRSIVVSGLRMPSHTQHRRLSPSTSATFLSYGIVVLLRQALELLIQEDQRVLGPCLIHRLSRFALLRRDHSSTS